jgi:hypothetical protein
MRNETALLSAIVISLATVGCGSGEDGAGAGAVEGGGAPGNAGTAASGGGGANQASAGADSTGSGGMQTGGAAISNGTGGANGTAGSKAGAGGAAGGGGSGGSIATGSGGAGGSSTGAQGACASTGIAVYTDPTNLLQLAWKGHGTFKENATGGCEGSKAYEYDWNVQGYWDGFLLNLSKPVDASKATAFTYAYKQGPSDPNFFFVRLHSGAKACGAGCDVEVHAGSADWKRETIPISTFVKSGEVDLTNVTAIEFGFSGPDASGTLLLDSMVFTQ